MNQEDSQRVLTVMVCSNRKRIFFTPPGEWGVTSDAITAMTWILCQIAQVEKIQLKQKNLDVLWCEDRGVQRGTATAQLLSSGKFSKRPPIAQLGGLTTCRNIGFCCYLEPFISQRRAQGLLLYQPVWSSEPQTYEEWMCLLSAVCVL